LAEGIENKIFVIVDEHRIHRANAALPARTPSVQELIPNGNCGRAAQTLMSGSIVYIDPPQAATGRGSPKPIGIALH
jgi:hypothetical protein